MTTGRLLSVPLFNNNIINRWEHFCAQRIQKEWLFNNWFGLVRVHEQTTAHAADVTCWRIFQCTDTEYACKLFVHLNLKKQKNWQLRLQTSDGPGIYLLGCPEWPVGGWPVHNQVWNLWIWTDLTHIPNLNVNKILNQWFLKYNPTYPKPNFSSHLFKDRHAYPCSNLTLTFWKS